MGRIILVVLALTLSTMAQSVVTGKVYDQNDAVLPGFDVRMLSGKQAVESVTDEDGSFYFSLAPGVYTFSTHGIGAGYWHPFKRSALLVKSNERLEIDLRPQRRILSTALVVTRRGVSEPVTLSPAPHYREFRFSENKDVRLVLQYSRSEKPGKLEEVTLTYDRYTITTNSAEYDNSKRTIELTGNVRYRVQSETVLAEKATVQLDTAHPFLSIQGKQIGMSAGTIIK